MSLRAKSAPDRPGPDGLLGVLLDHSSASAGKDQSKYQARVYAPKTWYDKSPPTRATALVASLFADRITARPINATDAEATEVTEAIVDGDHEVTALEHPMHW